MIRFIEPYQNENLNKINRYKINEPEYFDEKGSFYNDYDSDKSIKNEKSSKPPSEEKQPETREFNKNSHIRSNSNFDKKNDFLNKKKNRSPEPSPKQKPDYKTNKSTQKFYSGNEIKIYYIKTTLNKIKQKKEEESNKTFTQGMSNKSTESTELKVNQLSQENNQVSIQSEMSKSTKFISLLEEAHNQPEFKNIDKKDQLIETLQNFLQKKTLGDTLNRNIENENEETKESLETTSLDYFNELISKINSGIQQERKGDILVRLYYLIDTFKDSDKIKNEDIKRENKKCNLEDIIKTWIKKSFKEDFEEISKKELKKKKNQPKEKDNNKTESDLNFFETNFESFIEEHDLITKTEAKEHQKVTFEYINEINQAKDPVDFLKKMKKLDYLNKIKDVKFEKFLDEDKKAQENSYKTEKCRNKLNELYRSKNLEGLLFLSRQFYIDTKKDKEDKKDKKYIKIRDVEDFEKKIKDLEGYKDFTLELSQTENKNIQERAGKFEKIVDRLLNN